MNSLVSSPEYSTALSRIDIVVLPRFVLLVEWKVKILHIYIAVFSSNDMGDPFYLLKLNVFRDGFSFGDFHKSRIVDDISPIIFFRF